MKRVSIILIVILLAGVMGWAQDDYGIQKVGSVYNCWSNIYQMAEEDGRLYINASRASLQIMDVHDPANAEIVAKDFRIGTSDFVVENNFIYNYGNDSICVYDAADYQNIRKVGSLYRYRARDFTVSNGIVYVHHFLYIDRESFHTLSVIDFTNPAESHLIGTTVNLSSDIMSLDGNLMYCHWTDVDNHHSSHLAVFDVSDPDSVVKIGHSESFSIIRDIKIHNSLGFVASNDSLLTIFDVSDPSNLRTISTINNLGSIFNIYAVDDYVFTVGRIVAAIDVSDPEHPAVADSVERVETELFTKSILSGNTLAVSNYNQPRLWLIDVSDPTDLTIVYERKTPRYVLDVLPEGESAYVLFYKGGMGIVDISDPAHPVEESFLAFPQGNNYQSSFIKINNWIFCPFYESSEASGLNVIDVSDHSNPEIVLADTIGRVNNLARADHYLFVANSDNGLRIMDASDPLDISQISRFITNGSTVDVRVIGDYAYLIQHITEVVGERVNYYDLLTVDVSDIEQPLEVHTLRLPDDISSVKFVSASSALQIVCNRELRTYSLANPAEPEFVRYFRQDQILSAGATILNDRYLFFGASTLYGFDLTDEFGRPQNPVQVAYFDNPGYNRNLKIKDNLLFSAEQTQLGIYDISEAIGWQSVGRSEANSPVEWELLSVYPNPFNASVRIDFTLPAESLVRLNVYSSDGRLVGSILDGTLRAGHHKSQWTSPDLPTGLYFLKMEACGQIKTQKMVLVK